MKSIVILALGFLVLLASAQVEIEEDFEASADDLRAFTEAFYKEAFGIDINIGTCITTAGGATKVIKHAIKLFKGGRSTFSIVLSLNYIRRHFRDIGSAFKTCPKVVPRLISGIKELTPFTNADNISAASKTAIKKHPLGFPKQVNNARKAIAAGDWEKAGTAVGKLASYMIEGLPKTLSVETSY